MVERKSQLSTAENEAQTIGQRQGWTSAVKSGTKRGNGSVAQLDRAADF
jgi:hypothetical protein